MMIITEALTREECAELIEKTRQHLTPSLVQYGNRRLPSSMRHSENYRWREDGRISLKLRVLAALTIDVPLDLVEPIDVVRYPTGGFFEAHHDGNHRSHTLCIGLTSDYDGGDLEFPRKEASYHLSTGSGICWENDDSSFHRCTKVTRGEKWVAVVWVLKPTGEMKDG